MRGPAPDIPEVAVPPQHVATGQPLSAWRKGLYLTLGMGFLVLGTIGVVVPLLPTTPLILLAGYFFARSSARWYGWLLRHRLFGKMVRDWQERGAIGRRAKWTASAMLLVMMGLSLTLAAPALWVWLLCACCAAGILAFIWSRPRG